MSTEDTLELLKQIIVKHGKPLEFCSDFGPSFKGKFSQFCRENYIYHWLSTGYMPAHNGNAEVAIGKTKTIINKNPINTAVSHQELIAVANHRPASTWSSISIHPSHRP